MTIEMFSTVFSRPRARSAPLPWLLLVLTLPGLCAAEGIVPVPTTAAIVEHARYPAHQVGQDGAGYDGHYGVLAQYAAGGGAWKVGLWEAGPGTLVPTDYPNDEYCLVLEGRVEITNRDGTTAAFGPGDSFVIPKGWAGTWHMPTAFKKQFVAFHTR